MTWPPETEADVLLAISAGDLVESNRLDVKALVGDTSSARKETAKDLASFAVDGGALLIGVHEDKEARLFAAAPIDLHDVLERIEQIAANRIEPPLVVHPREIPSGPDGAGYVWVDIPASPDAPHMVDGRYYGRGERTNRILHDAEILRLHRAKEDRQERSRRALNSLQDRDPYVTNRTTGQGSAPRTARFGHLYLVATPQRPRPRLAQGLVWDRVEHLYDFIIRADAAVPSTIRSFGPRLGGFSTVTRSASAVLTNLTEATMQVDGTEAHGLEVHVGTDASVGMIVTRISTPGDERSANRVLDGYLLANTWRLLSWANSLAEATSYSGGWTFGLRATQLRGRTSHVFAGHAFDAPSTELSEDTYEQTTIATLQDLAAPAATVRALVEPLMRALGTWPHWIGEVPDLAVPAREHH